MRKDHFLLCIALPLAVGLGLTHMVFGRPRTNPVVEQARSVEARLEVPRSMQAILEHSCSDCHSNRTRWPWFASIAPASWFISRDVERGRRAMNLSDWTVKPRIAIATLAAACQTVQLGRMPPAAYRWMHPEGRLTSEQVSKFCGWADREERALRDEITRRMLKSARFPVPYGPNAQP
jgi:hypothetical protein